MAKSEKYPRRVYRMLLKEKYPKYAPLHNWLTEVLYVMQNDPFEDFKIHIDNIQEPTKISVTIYSTYGS